MNWRYNAFMSFEISRRASPIEIKVNLAPDMAQWVDAELAAGRYATAEEAVRFALDVGFCAIGKVALIDQEKSTVD